MTSKNENQNSGLPAPITQLTAEQDLRLRLIWDACNKPETDKKDIIIFLMALQKQNFVLGNSLTNLVEKWPKVHPTINEVPAMFWILLENKS